MIKMSLSICEERERGPSLWHHWSSREQAQDRGRCPALSSTLLSFISVPCDRTRAAAMEGCGVGA